MERPAGQHPEPEQSAFDQAWREHRRYLLDVAYRMLGSVSDAEDIVQEAFARLVRADPGEIDDLRGWLVVVVSRLCLDQLRSARSRRETYPGPWLPEPLIQPPGGEFDPAERVTLDDSVRMALLVVLERLTPAERAVFVLHDLFRFSFEDVARIVGRSPEACRQLASRARRHVQQQTDPARFDVDQRQLRRVAARFIQASSNGDLDALMDVLDPQVVGWTDSGGIVAAPREPVVGRQQVAERFLRFVKDYRVKLVPMPVNGEPGALALRDGRLISVVVFEARHGLITRIHGIANPHKLAYVASLLQGTR
jgi:RNA polymerase sigma-70 factor (ECF subfamily)